MAPTFRLEIALLESLIASLFAAVLLLVSPFVCADELVLKEGKSIQGKITKEDADEYTILMGSQMYLRVAKEKVARVVRDTPAKPNKPIVRTPVASPKAVNVSTAVAAVPSPSSNAPVAATAVKPSPAKATPSPGVVATPSISPAKVTEPPQQTVKKGVVTIEENVAASKTGKTTLQTVWEGTPEKEANQTKWKAVILRATIANDPTSPHAKQEVDSLRSSLSSFAEELTALRANDEKTLRSETDRLLAVMQDHAKKRLQGLARREKKEFDKKQK